MASAESPPVPPAPESAPPSTIRARHRLPALAALAVLLGFIVVGIPALYKEWRALQEDQLNDRLSRVIGYPGIEPLPNFAQRPEDWLHDEGEHTLLWSGWTPGVGHGWFRVRRGEIDTGRLLGPFCRDVVRAIDWPIVEAPGDTHWDQIPAEVPVVGLEWNGKALAYPLLVLQKVQVVNDTIDDEPLLVTCTPTPHPERAIHAFDPTLDGDRLTLGSSGYLHDHKPVLYDRGTESLWVIGDECVLAIAGRHKGKRLRPVATPILAAWGDWLTRFPRSRLVVGADRTKGLPRR